MVVQSGAGQIKDEIWFTVTKLHVYLCLLTN